MWSVCRPAGSTSARPPVLSDPRSAQNCHLENVENFFQHNPLINCDKLYCVIDRSLRYLVVLIYYWLPKKTHGQKPGWVRSMGDVAEVQTDTLSAWRGQPLHPRSSCFHHLFFLLGKKQEYPHYRTRGDGSQSTTDLSRSLPRAFQ